MNVNVQSLIESMGSLRQPCRPVSVDYFWVDENRRCIIREGKCLVYFPKYSNGPLDLITIRDDTLMIDVEAEGEGGLEDELRHRLAELWIALVDPSADSLTHRQLEIRNKLESLFEVEEMSHGGEG